VGRAASRPASASIPRTATNTASKNSARCCAAPAFATSPPGPTSATGLRCSTPAPDAGTAMNDPRGPHSIDLHGRDYVPADCETLRSRFARIRAHSFNLSKPLSEEDCCVQSMPDASPVKWHLAHTTWFFETFVLEKYEESFQPFLPAFRVLFNSYYNGVGEKHPRPQRGLLTRPSMAEVRAYRANVDERMAVLISSGIDAELASLITLGLQHEQQHQELMLTDVKHLLAQNPLMPAYR